MADGPSIAIACDLTALSPAEREQRQLLAERVWSGALDVRELTDGYAVRVPADADSYRQVAELLLLERRCCPFFRLGIELEENHGPIWVRLTGGPGVKEFLAQTGIAQLAPSPKACC